MSPTQSWHEWIARLVAQFASAKACAGVLGIDESTLSRWRRPYFQEPTALDMERLARQTQTPLPELLLIVWTARRAREAFRVPPTIGRGSGPSRPKRPSDNRRGKRDSVALLVAV